MPKRRCAAKGGGKHKKHVEFPKTPHGPVLGQGKMKGGGFLGRLGGALADSLPQMALGLATDNPYFLAQGASTFVGRAADDDRYDVMNRGAAGEMTSLLGQARLWRGPSAAPRLRPRRMPTRQVPQKDILNLDDIKFPEPPMQSVMPRAAPTAAPLRPSLMSRARSAASGFAARSRDAIRRITSNRKWRIENFNRTHGERNQRVLDAARSRMMADRNFVDLPPDANF